MFPKQVQVIAAQWIQRKNKGGNIRRQAVSLCGDTALRFGRRAASALRVMSCRRGIQSLISGASRPFLFRKSAKSQRSYGFRSAEIFPVLGQVLITPKSTLDKTKTGMRDLEIA